MTEYDDGSGLPSDSQRVGTWQPSDAENAFFRNFIYECDVYPSLSYEHVHNVYLLLPCVAACYYDVNAV